MLEIYELFRLEVWRAASVPGVPMRSERLTADDLQDEFVREMVHGPRGADRPVEQTRIRADPKVM